MRIKVWDLLFIVVLSILLLLLNENEKIELLFAYPFLTIYFAYLLGRFAGSRESTKKKDQ